MTLVAVTTLTNIQNLPIWLFTTKERAVNDKKVVILLLLQEGTKEYRMPRYGFTMLWLQFVHDLVRAAQLVSSSIV